MDRVGLAILEREFRADAAVMAEAARRGHHAKCFSIVLAGGGLKTGRAIGTSDALGMKPVVDPISIPDFHATIHAALGTNPAEELYDGARPVPLTDGGKPIASLV